MNAGHRDTVEMLLCCICQFFIIDREEFYLDTIAGYASKLVAFPIIGVKPFRALFNVKS